MTLLEQQLRDLLADVMDVAPQELSVGVDLEEQGVDSLVALRFSRRISDLVGSEVELEALFDYPTIAALAGFLGPRFAPATAAVATGANHV